jgi:putative DNA primase/helicase
MIDGCLDWQKNGLVRPAVVIEATNEYFSEQDTIRLWIEECCDVGPKESGTSDALFASWKSWADRNGETAGSAKNFKGNLVKAGFKWTKNTPHYHGRRGFLGISVQPVDTSEQWQNRDD